MDKICKTLILDNQLTLAVLDTTELVNKAIKIHGLSRTAAAALGRTLTATAFMASNLKNKNDKLSITIAGNGEGGNVVTSANSDLTLRGYVDNPTVNPPLRADGKLNVGAFVGNNGRLTVVKSMGLKEPFTSSSELISGEIAEDFAAYFAFSEQQPTAISLGVKIGKDDVCVGAGGVVIQTLPFASEEAIAKAEEVMKNFNNISSLIETLTPEKILKDYFDVESFEEYHPKYECVCTKDYIERILISLGKEELNDIIKEQGKVEVNCQFCNKNYVFYKEDIDKLF